MRQAIHWVRSRQEEREFAYWLSIVSYDPHDRSLNNNVYLIYLILFFGAWIFVTLTFFASGGAILLRLINANDPVRAAIFLEILILGVWNVYALWQSVRHSPVVFSEQDATLICQMPVSHRQVTLRWFLMPWLESAIPFWLVAITIGFSLAEIAMPGTMTVDRIFEYAGYGMRAWLGIIPIHLGLFLLQWVVGVFRLQKDRERHWLALPVMTLAILLLVFLLVFMLAVHIPSFIPGNTILEFLIFPLQGGLGKGSLSVSLLSSGLFSIVMLGLLAWLSDTFSLSRAAQETQEIETLNSAFKFGLTTYAQELQTKKRLGVLHAPSRLPMLRGAGALLWKDILQSLRSFKISMLQEWVTLFAVMLGFSLLPDLGSRVFALAIWVIQIGVVSVTRLRSDLSNWSLVRQLPIAHKKFLFYDLSLPYFLSVIISLIGLGIGTKITGTSVVTMVILIPGMTAGVAGMTAFDMIRRSRSNLLLSGSVPGISGTGILLGLMFALFPVLILTLLPGVTGYILATLTSLLLGWGAFNLADRAYKNIDAS